METDKERFSFDVYDGHKFPLRISPVKFGDSGRYICYYDGHVAATVTLVTIRVSAEPPGGLSRNQSVVLNCEISQVIDSVTLAWLRMKGGRGELVKQEVLTERAPKRCSASPCPSLTEDQLHWACVVFTGSVLRAQVPLHLTLLAVGGNADSSGADNIYSDAAEIQNDQANPRASTEETESEELQYSVFSQTALSLVSAEPPGGLSRNQSVVLNCEISRVIDSVTLAWLRMKGGRGELVKQEVLTERAPKTMLSLTLPSLTEDQLHWACVVFTGSVLRAQVPLHLTLLGMN
ncbi:hypothetical protein COCON_G00054920 [Conger conger]|uniref:Ig-like domain-containing protein n=1 Tax=Conger conger TaxID=82655 RepID=A0A9Q1I613_CONCO|nr:hypothetical protein COCON_G00054920 [Conger conger]